MKKRWIFATASLAVFVMGTPRTWAFAADCTNTTVGLVPINDLGAGLYLNQFQGGLYPGGANVPPAAHATEGLARAHGLQPLDTAGLPDPNGKIVLLSIGMSNTTQEFCSQDSFEPCNAWTFMGQAVVDSRVNTTTLAIVNGARGGQAATSWDSPTDPNYDGVRDQKLAPKGLTEAQVQVIWVKQANPQPSVSLPNASADAFALEASLADIARAAKVRYPNLSLMFLSSRIYAGYASTTLNPEPYAYESAFSIKWLIEAQVQQIATGTADPLAGDLDYNTVAPWIAWGPYTWADGLTPRSDGLIWVCTNLESDGTHPATSGEEKVGSMLLRFMLSSPFASPWFAICLAGDPNNDGSLNMADLNVFVAVLLGLDTDALHVAGSDMDCDGNVNGKDIAPLLAALLAI